VNTIRLFVAGALFLGAGARAHDEDVGARFVHTDGINGSDCLDQDAPCRSIQYAVAQAEPGNTVKVAAGIYDMSGVEPETFLFGTTKAAGGYTPDDRYAWADPDVNLTILVGVDPRYRQPMARQGFKWAADRASAAAGQIDTSVAEALQATQAVPASCVQGLAGQFPCRNVDFAAQIPLSQFSTVPASAANLWGFVDLNDQREYAVIGLRNGTAVVDVTDPASPREVGTVPGNGSAWREVKIYQHFDAGANRYRAYAYISTEAPGSGLQVIDLSGLPSSVALATTLIDTGSQHTLYVSNIDYATNVALPGHEAFLYSAGSNLNAGAWRKYSLANPASPQVHTLAPQGTEYMHDSTSLLITDNRTTQCDQARNPCQVLVDFNENSVDLWDVTAEPVRLSSTTYPAASYTHSGWPSADQMHVFFHDELEEIYQSLNTQIYTMLLSDLRAPFIATSYLGPDTTTDHNGYTKGDLYYVSHYRRGLVVFDVSNPGQLREVGHFDTFLTPSANVAGTDGAWGVYPFLPSGTIVVSDITNGLFVLEDRTVTLAQSAGQIGFVGTASDVTEGGGVATVRVQRTGGFAGVVTVDYATSDLSASAGTEYTAVSGTLTWADGELSAQQFTVPIVDDTLPEPAETFRIVLSNPSGGATIDGSTTFDVTIIESDIVPPPVGRISGGGAIDLAWLTLLATLTAVFRAQAVPSRSRALHG
jgi:choice-of-anchor B domain-containing protein